MFDLITVNTIKVRGFADRFAVDAEFNALYKLYFMRSAVYTIDGTKERSV